MSVLKVRDANGNIIPIPSIQGKSAYEYAKDGGYKGTEEEFAQMMATGITNGGSSGGTGTDGFSPIANVTQTTEGVTISITDKNGTTTAKVNHGVNGKDGTNGTTPQRGVDYWTTSDIQTIKSYVDDAILGGTW